MKKKLKIGAIALLAVVLFISIILLLLFFYKKHVEEQINKDTEIEYLSILDDGTYYLPSVDTNIAFEIKLNSNDYTIIDEDGNRVKTIIKKVNNKYYIVNNKGYDKGTTYTLNVNNNYVVLNDKENIKKVVFRTKREETSEFEYEDNVKNYENLDIKDNALDITGLDIQNGDILILDNGNNSANAYKVVGIENNVATLETPELNEIYKEFDLYQEKKLDFSNIKNKTIENDANTSDDNTMNENSSDSQIGYSDNLVNNVSTKDDVVISLTDNTIDTELIKRNLENSTTYKFLKDEAEKVGSDIDSGVDFEADAYHIIIVFRINIKGNTKGFLGMDTLANHDLSLTYTINVDIDYIADIQKLTSFNLGVKTNESIDLDVSISYKYDAEATNSKLTDEAYDRTVQDIVNRLESETPDKARGSNIVGAIEVPTEIPFVNVYMDLYFQADVELALDAKGHIGATMGQTVGLALIDKEFYPYYYDDRPTATINVDIYGKATASVGIGFNVGLSFLSKDLANVNISLEFGPYVSAFVYTKGNVDSDVDSELYLGGRVEAGLYFKSGVNANVDSFFLKKSYNKNLIDIKAPIITLGEDEAMIGIKAKKEEVEIKTRDIALPAVYKQIFTVSTGETKDGDIISIDELELLDVDGNAIEDKIKFDEDNKYVVVLSYKEDNKEYRTKVTLINEYYSTGAEISFNPTMNDGSGSDVENVNVPSDGKMFKDHFYRVFDTGLTWEEAKLKCEEMGGHLVTINSQEEQEFVQNLLNEGNKNYYWLGAKSSSANNFTSWVTGEVIEYTNYDVDEPSNSNGGESVLSMYRVTHPYHLDRNTVGFWNDLPSNGENDRLNFYKKENSGYICEWDNYKIISTEKHSTIKNAPTDAKTFNNHAYKTYAESSVTWLDAKQKCETLGGYLVTITSQEEQNFIESINSKKLWIGGYLDNGVWKWVTNEEWSYTNWGSGEPNNSSNVVANEGYVAVWPKKWNDLANTNLYEQSGYICEWG